jgi:heavy metal translocating P-type ATPase
MDIQGSATIASPPDHLVPGPSPAPEEPGEGEHGLETIELARIGVVAVASLLVWLRVWEPFPHVSVIGVGAALVGGYPILREALSALAARRMTMELSMTIAIAAALGIGEFFTALVIIGFVLIAEVLEGLTVGRGRNAIRELLALLPQQVLVHRAGTSREVPAADVRAGDVVVVKPGARVPVDGIVVAGNSFVDQASITGESLPVEKVAGAHVFAGTINQTGALEVRTTSVGRDTAFGRIIEAVERAERSRAPIQKTADRLAGYLVYFALGCAVLTFAVTRDARSTISVVIVAGACGIAAGTPLAILGAIGRAARMGAVIKGGLHLETLGRVDTVVLDKTGTLTWGAPEVVAVHAVAGTTEQEVLAAAAAAERPSEHPLARAILKRAAEQTTFTAEGAALGVEAFEYLPGKGIRCKVRGEEILVGTRALLAQNHLTCDGVPETPPDRSEVMVAKAGRLLGVIHAADVLRPEAKRAVRALRHIGIETILLTGDAAPVTRAVATELGVTDWAAELLPEQKLQRIEALLAERKVVAMVGDGVNDAPALMRASVGVAMGSGTEVARESANVVLLGNDLLKLVEVIRTARWCRRIIMTNFVGTLVVDGVGVGLAAFGLLNPLLAAFIHVASELAFILNSARLVRHGSRPSSRSSS